MNEIHFRGGMLTPFLTNYKELYITSSEALINIPYIVGNGVTFGVTLTP